MERERQSFPHNAGGASQDPQSTSDLTQRSDYHTHFPSKTGHVRSFGTDNPKVHRPHLDPAFFFSAAPIVVPPAPSSSIQASTIEQTVSHDGPVTRSRARKPKVQRPQDGGYIPNNASEAMNTAQHSMQQPSQLPTSGLPHPTFNTLNGQPFLPRSSTIPWPPPPLPPGTTIPPPPLPPVIPGPPLSKPKWRKNQRGQDLRISILERPVPNQAYLLRTSLGHEPLPSPQPLLIILDLNGVLVHRRKTSKTAFTPRPNLDAFLDYLFSRHHVMVWSSGKHEYVTKICERLFTKSQFDSLIGIWSRDRLRLTPELSAQNVQVYKQLAWIWEDTELQAKAGSGTGLCERGVEGGGYRQENTILIDDSMEKAAAEPFNLLEIDEFVGVSEKGNGKKGTLMEVLGYLEVLERVSNVSAFMKEQPFRSAGTNV